MIVSGPVSPIKQTWADVPLSKEWQVNLSGIASDRNTLHKIMILWLFKRCMSIIVTKGNDPINLKFLQRRAKKCESN